MINAGVRTFVESQKDLLPNVAWTQDTGFSQARSNLLVDGVGVAGLFLRIKIPHTVDAHGSMLQLEFDSRSGTDHLTRIDWKAEHTNPNKGPTRLRLLHIPSTHVHSFELNYVEDEQRMRQKDLPIAEAVEPEPQTLEEFFALGERMLKITGLSGIVRPPYQAEFF